MYVDRQQQQPRDLFEDLLVNLHSMWKTYEHQAIRHHQDANSSSIAWHWKNVPHEELVRSGWHVNLGDRRIARLSAINGGTAFNELSEYGLDGLARNVDGSYTGIQVKCWNTSLNANSIGTFQSVVITVCAKMQHTLPSRDRAHPPTIRCSLNNAYPRREHACAKHHLSVLPH
jgi:hypothetical protein